jgi:hypothetical protein
MVLENIFVIFHNVKASISILPIVPNEQFFEELFIDGTFGAVVLN